MTNARGRSLLAGSCLVLMVAACSLADPSPGYSFDSLTMNGCWTWYGDPKAIYHQGNHEKTYTGWVTNTGDIVIASYNHQTGEKFTHTLHVALEPDDHDHPSLHILPDGRIMAFYSRHSGPFLYYSTTVEPEDISAWEPVTLLPVLQCCYPNVMRLEDEDNRMYVFFRGDTRQPTFITSSDSGATWTQPVKMIQGGDRPYVKYVSDGRGRIHIAFENGHRQNSHSWYYMYYEGGFFYKADGTLIKSIDSLPVQSVEAEVIYDNIAEERKSASVWDIALDEDGYPVIVWVKMMTTSDHFYIYNRWTGTQWTRTELLNSGGDIGSEWGFSGGITLDHGNPNIVYLSRRFGFYHEIERWVTYDKGHSWISAPITAGSSNKNMRPCVPRNAPPKNNPAGLIWLYGSYESWGNGQFWTRVNMCDPDSVTSPLGGIRIAPPNTIAPNGNVAFYQGAIVDFDRDAMPTNRVWFYDISGRRLLPGRRMSQTPHFVIRREGIIPSAIRD